MYPQAHGKIKFLLAGLLMMFVLSACGQKGDLYHPEDKQSAVAPAFPNA